MRAAGPRILAKNLVVGALGAFLVYVGAPGTITPVDRLTLEFGAFILLSCLGAVLLRCEHPFQDWGCLLGPLGGFGWFLGWCFLFDFLKVNPSSTVCGALILLSIVSATWASLPTLSVIDLVAYALYALVVGGAGVWIAVQWPGVNGLVQGLITFFFAAGALVVTVLGHSVGRRKAPPGDEPEVGRVMSFLVPALAPTPVAKPAVKPPAKLPTLSLPEGALPLPTPEFVRTDGQRAFCCGENHPFPAWLFQAGRWEQLVLRGGSHEMEWPKAVGVDRSGNVVLMTRSDVSYDAHIEDSIWCDLWYCVRGREVREMDQAPSVREWWGEGRT